LQGGDRLALLGDTVAQRVDLTLLTER